ncbi:ligand-binding protein SH3 [Nocardioides speluncae]|uniref:ligand-binding protein SH3 n=1 Tax=Nocardioides speluncae TaxID=2670337 RepID=UPI000D68F9F0|nr:ligand-binding protein SH3 [Nocardioides speluncae]
MAKHRHKRVSNARRLPKAAMIAAPVAVAATFAGVGGGLVGAKPSKPDRIATEAGLGGALDRDQPASRSLSRDLAAEKKRKRAAALKAQKARQAKLARQEREATRRAVKNAKIKLWSTEELNLWSSSEESAEQLGTLDAGERVLVTGRKADEREEIVLEGEAFWVTAGYLQKEKPEEVVPGIGGECENGTSVPSGVSSSIAKVHQAVCARFPEITIYGTLRGGGGDHGIGKAVDIMVSGDRGWEVAEYVRANYAALGVSYVIYSQSMWSVERSGEGWRAMEDRGSATANHYDHVHVSVF